MSDAPILDGIHRVDDIDAVGDFEKKHTPYVECTREGDRVRVYVKVGHYVSHPNTPDHFIEWIDILADGQLPLARLSFSAVAADPEGTVYLNVDPGTKLTALENCNLHGVWAWDVVAP